MLNAGDARDTALVFNLHNTPLKFTLPTTSKHNLLTGRLRYLDIRAKPIHFVLFPLNQSDRRLQRMIFGRSMSADKVARLGS
jgi:hypothetical protein